MMLGIWHKMVVEIDLTVSDDDSLSTRILRTSSVKLKIYIFAHIILHTKNSLCLVVFRLYALSWINYYIHHNYMLNQWHLVPCCVPDYQLLMTYSLNSFKCVIMQVYIYSHEGITYMSHVTNQNSHLIMEKLNPIKSWLRTIQASC